jgi:hypothetical protein
MKRCLAILLPALVAGGAGCATLNEIGKQIGNTKVQYKMKNGEKIEGTLLQTEDGTSLVQLKYGAVTVTSGDVESHRELGPAEDAPAGAERLTPYTRALRLMVQQPWGASLLQVPATLVGTGSLKNVPYTSFRAGNFEINVYGDPDAPAGLEVGVYGSVHSGLARRTCLNAMKALLTDRDDHAMLDKLDLEGAEKSRAGLTFEVTPSTAPDAFGGWWVSVYDKAAMKQQEASDRELALITVPRSQIKAAPAPSVTAWKPHELRLSRPEEQVPADQGRVYLRGIHRKNGAYQTSKSI